MLNKISIFMLQNYTRFQNPTITTIGDYHNHLIHK